MFEKLTNPDNKLNQVCNLIIDVFLTGLFTFICALPIITLSTSLTAGYYTTAKVVRHHEGYVWTEFFKSFKRNFKTSFGIGFFYLLAVAIVVFDWLYLKNNSEEMSDILIFIILAVAVMIAVTYFFVCFELSRFDKRGFQIFKFGVVTAFRHFPSAFAVAAMFALAGFMVYKMPWGFCLFPGFALYGSTFLMEKIMRKYMPVPEEGSPEADKWYYK